MIDTWIPFLAGYLSCLVITALIQAGWRAYAGRRNRRRTRR